MKVTRGFRSTPELTRVYISIPKSVYQSQSAQKRIIPCKLFSLVELRPKKTTKFLRTQIKTNIDKDRAYSALLLSSTRVCLIFDFLLKMWETHFLLFSKFSTAKILQFVFPKFCQRKTNIKQTLIVYKVPPGDIFANNYGRGHLKSSNQVRSDIQLPLSYEN